MVRCSMRAARRGSLAHNRVCWSRDSAVMHGLLYQVRTDKDWCQVLFSRQSMLAFSFPRFVIYPATYHVLEVRVMATPSAQLSTDQILTAVTHLSLSELDQLFAHGLALQAKGKAAHLSAIESGLLMRINQDLPSEICERLAVLRTKREDETITDTEYEELTRLTDQAEELHAARMAALVELATLRGLPLPVLMDQLGIHFPAHV